MQSAGCSQVNVVGTCDSPVQLMEMVARLLGYKPNDLQFDLGGMHHFGWITGITHQGEDLLPEALRRVVEMPKLGVDAELVQALGVIPSFYGKYYLHPDRILAETEGRTIRAHQLMQLSDQLLAEYRGWKPGEPPRMLAKRGAAWYEKIVAPALMAFAEEQTTEMVLSVENNGTFPWLPAGAIIETPVAIEAGKITKHRPARPAAQYSGAGRQELRL